MNGMIQIVIFDSDKTVLHGIGSMIRKSGELNFDYSLFLFSQTYEFINFCRSGNQIDIFLLDLYKNGKDCMDAVNIIREHQNAAIILYTYECDGYEKELMDGRHPELLPKPFSQKQLSLKLNQLVKRIAADSSNDKAFVSPIFSSTAGEYGISAAAMVVASILTIVLD